jgi:hypothetical protein
MNEEVKDMTESHLEGYTMDPELELSGTWSSYNI